MTRQTALDSIRGIVAGLAGPGNLGKGDCVMALRVALAGSLVELEADTYTNKETGKSYPFYGAYVRPYGASLRERAERVRISGVQFGALKEGQEIEWPVDISLHRDDNGNTKLRIQLPEDYDCKAGKLSAVASA